MTKTPGPDDLDEDGIPRQYSEYTLFRLAGNTARGERASRRNINRMSDQELANQRLWSEAESGHRRQMRLIIMLQNYFEALFALEAFYAERE